MFVSVSRHLRSNVVAYLALLFALSGTSSAAATKLLPANSVGTRQVINHSLLKQDFKPGQLPRGHRGPQGPQGPQGPKASKDPRGRRGHRERRDRRASSVSAASNSPIPMSIQPR
jgi:hypothetical protein